MCRLEIVSGQFIFDGQLLEHLLTALPQFGLVQLHLVLQPEINRCKKIADDNNKPSTSLSFILVSKW